MAETTVAAMVEVGVDILLHLICHKRYHVPHVMEVEGVVHVMEVDICMKAVLILPGMCVAHVVEQERAVDVLVQEGRR